MTFPCSKCNAACCRLVLRSPTTQHLDRGDGVCVYLNTDTNLCSIYYQRPWFCNIDLIYDGYMPNTDRAVFYKLTEIGCDWCRERV